MIPDTALKTAPTTEPVTLAEAQSHCRVTDEAEAAYLTSLITAARQMAEVMTGRALITQTWYAYWNFFPNELRLPFPPLVSITAITYKDTAGASQTLAAALYEVHTEQDPGVVVRAYGASWPSTYGMPNVIRAEYVCGYGAATAVPQAIKQAMLFQISHWYENREAVAAIQLKDVPLSVDALLSAYRHGWEWT